jgi:hypothetical protein
MDRNYILDYTVTNAHGNIGCGREISNKQLCSFLQSMGKSFMKCINKEIYGKFPGK